MLILFLIFSVSIGAIIGIPLSIANEVIKAKNKKAAQILANQRYQADLKYKQEVLEQMKLNNKV